MVKINNQRKAFLDMLAWSEGTDNGRQKTRNHGYDVIVGRRAIYWLLRSPSQTCHAKPKTQINRRGRYSFFPLVELLPLSSLLRTSLRKVRTLWHCSRLRAWRFRWCGGIIRLMTVAKISGLHWALVMVSSSIKLTLITKFKEAGGTVREIDVWEYRDYLRSNFIAIITCHGLLIIIPW